jgi:hypothetical protein
MMIGPESCASGTFLEQCEQNLHLICSIYASWTRHSPKNFVAALSQEPFVTGNFIQFMSYVFFFQLSVASSLPSIIAPFLVYYVEICVILEALGLMYYSCSDPKKICIYIHICIYVL